MSRVLAQLDVLDRALVDAGFPAMTSWWRETLATFYVSGRRQLVLRVGRRGGKSSTLCRVAVAEAIFGEHEIPPGDVGVVAFVSVRREEAAERLRMIRAILDTLGIVYKPIDSGVELVDRPIVFRVFTASLSGVVGGTVICAVCDEVARWRDLDTGANPAREVLASLRPALAGQPHAKLFLSSSPMGRQDAHAVAFDVGDSDFQLVTSAQTWIARPALTEAECRALEPDEETFLREYGVVPFDGSTSSLFGEAALVSVTRKGDLVQPRRPGIVYFAAEDPAARANGWTVVVGHARRVSEDLVSVVVDGAREWRAPRGGALDTDHTYLEIADWVGGWGVTELWTDQWSFDTRRALAARHSLTLHLATSTQTTKVQSTDAFRRRVADRLIELPDLPSMRADLLGVRRWIGKGGAFTIELEKVGGRHCDFAPALFLLAEKVFAEDDAQPDWLRPGAVRGMAEAMAAVGGGGFSADSLGSRAQLPFPDESRAAGPTLRARRGPDGEVTLEGSPHDWPARFMAVVARGRPTRHGREASQWGDECFANWSRAVEAWRTENRII